MKSKPYIVWVLGVFIVMASLDTVPDPPAVNSQTVNVASRTCEARSGLCEPRLNHDRSRTSYHLRLRWIDSTVACEPLPSDCIVLTGRAADPSPPAL